MYKQAVFSEHKKIILIFSKSSMKFYLNLFKVTLKLFIPIFHFLDKSLTFSLSFSILARSSMFEIREPESIITFTAAYLDYKNSF